MATILSGIYRIRNTQNGHCYIGSAKDIYSRWSIHVFQLNHNKHHSQYLQNSWNKYGSDCFEFSVIEVCPVLSLIAREQYYIDLNQPVYNVSRVAGSSLGTKRSSESRAKMSAKKKSSTPRKQTLSERLKRSLTLTGHVVSQETKDKISAAHKGKVGNKGYSGHKHSVETKAKISASQKGKAKSPETKAKMVLAWIKRRRSD
jgi:group I intron endonuclease